jgi:hypothetical protein
MRRRDVVLWCEVLSANEAKKKNNQYDESDPNKSRFVDTTMVKFEDVIRGAVL